MSEKTVTVRVPGTTANCGPGFDSMGMACTIYNELTLTLLEDETIDIEVTGAGAEDIPINATNVVWTTVRYLLEKAGNTTYHGCRMRMHNNVPLSRGLGSSATAIVAGLKAANVILDNYFDDDQLLKLATDIEGHPDNVAPAIFGGFTISAMHEGVPQCYHFMPEMPLKLVVAVPDFYLSTSKSRKVLRTEVSLKDAIFNVGRASMLAAALAHNNAEFLKIAIDDKLHQPYRAQLIPGMYDVFAKAKEAGALGVAMSGAGPCIIAFTLENNEAVGEAMKNEFARHYVNADILQLELDSQGAIVIEN